MNKSPHAARLAFLALPLLMLAGCATVSNEASVVRFHTGQPINRGTIALVPVNPADADSLQFRTLAESVAVELRRQGYTTVPAVNLAQYVGIVSVTQATRASGQRNSGVTVGLGGGFSSGNVGIGTSAQIPVGQRNQQSGITATTLNVRINSNSNGSPVWEGRATKDAVAGTPAADPTNAVPLLSRALFQDFPGTPGATQQVRL